MMLAAEACSNRSLEAFLGYGKSPCFSASRVLGSVGLDWRGVVSAWSNMAFGRM